MTTPVEATRAPYPSTAGAELIARLERAPFSRWHLRARIVMGSATFFDAFDALSLAFVLPVLVRLWDISAVQIGWLIAIGYLGQLAGALIFGALAERYGRVPSAAGATALMSVMSIACALAGNFPVLLLLRLIQGIGVGGEVPVAAVYINELSRAHGRGRFFLLYEMIFPIGLMVTGQIGALVVPTLGWQVMFLIGGVPGLAIAALLLRLRESPRWLIGRGRLTEAEAIIREIEGTSGTTKDTKIRSTVGGGLQASGTGDLKVSGSGDRIGHDRSGIRTRWTELLSPTYRGRTTTAWALWACAYFITNGLNNWMPTLYNRVYGLSLDQALRAGTLTNVAQVVILLGCAFTIDRIGRRRWMTACFIGGALLLGALGSAASGSVAAVIALVTLSYGIVGSANTVLYLYTPEIYPTRMRAIGTGLATCWLRLASAAGPLLVGYLVAARGTAAVFMMFAAAGVVGGLTATQMLETRNRRLEDIAP
ncbi:MAG TPA: MFS transporter [Vicinamibacterales bacterium]|nr:MFS transporter [Vicinamibacterales bacterium]